MLAQGSLINVGKHNWRHHIRFFLPRTGKAFAFKPRPHILVLY
ncbi:Uncharacterised protein [Vibrio cholerae]|nr:Uncharacterised protein [Vibrio cholerae]